jgi:hypothetical protein
MGWGATSSFLLFQLITFMTSFVYACVCVYVCVCVCVCVCVQVCDGGGEKAKQYYWSCCKVMDTRTPPACHQCHSHCLRTITTSWGQAFIKRVCLQYSQTCKIRTPFEQTTSFPISEVSSFQCVHSCEKIIFGISSDVWISQNVLNSQGFNWKVNQTLHASLLSTVRRPGIFIVVVIIVLIIIITCHHNMSCCNSVE